MDKIVHAAAGAGAIELGLAGIGQPSILVDVVGLSGGLLELAYLGVGLAGAITVYHQLNQ